MTLPGGPVELADSDAISEGVRRVPLFSRLDEHELAQAARSFQPVGIAAGEVVFHEGEAGDALYIIASGQVRIVSGATGEGVPLAQLRAGQYFGEMALVTGEPRTAAAVAAEDSQLLVLDRDGFDALAGRLPGLRTAFDRVTGHRGGGARIFENEAYDLLSLASARGRLSIGSDPSNDIVLDVPGVAAFHAQIEDAGDGFRLIDLGSGAGTYRNREPVGEAALVDGDLIWVGSARLFVHDGVLKLFQPSRGMRVDAVGLGRSVGRGHVILEDVDLSIFPGELVAIIGPSGAGKTTLMHLLLGLDAPSTGEVFYDGLALGEAGDAFRSALGYVPQADIVHRELTVRESLVHSARLRLPAAEAQAGGVDRRVARTLEHVRLSGAAGTRIGDLSGGERKRASVAVELLGAPRVLFLDEPTSGLDPGLDDQLMHGFREMADAGCTVILTTHATRNIRICDRLVVVCGGRLAFVGTPAEALRHFAIEDFVYLYPLLENGQSMEIAAKFRDSRAYQRKVTVGIGNSPAGAPMIAVPPAPTAAPAPALASGKRIARQYLQLLRRDLLILSRRRVDLALRLFGAPLLAANLLMIVDGAIFAEGDARGGNVRAAMTLLYLLSAVSLFLGAIIASSVITGEDAIFRRERLVNLSPLSYVLAKVTVLACFAAIQAALMVAVIAPVIEFPAPHPGTELTVVGVLTVTTFAGMMMGLFISSISPNADRAVVLAVFAIVPQLIFGGSTVPRSEMSLPAKAVSDATISKWALELLGETTGIDRRIYLQSAHSVYLGAEFGGGVTVIVDTPFDNAFKVSAASRWAALAGFSLLFIAGTLFVQSRKGRRRARAPEAPEA